MSQLARKLSASLILAFLLSSCVTNSSSQSTAASRALLVKTTETENQRRLNALKSYKVGETTMSQLEKDGLVKAIGTSKKVYMPVDEVRGKYATDKLVAVSGVNMVMTNKSPVATMLLTVWQGPIEVRDRYGNLLSRGKRLATMKFVGETLTDFQWLVDPKTL